MFYILLLMFFFVGAAVGSGNAGYAAGVCGIISGCLTVCFMIAAMSVGDGFGNNVLELFNKWLTFNHEIEKKKLEREED